MTTKNKPNYTKALIYCRVSSSRQKTEGHGLESQEQRCREYAEHKGYEVERVFPDDFSGGGDFMRRPAMSELLGYLDSRPHINYVVIFDDLKRFARDVEFHWKLRKEFTVRDARPECLNFNFEDTPEGEFLETILAAQGQLERQQNRRQVIQKMKARLQDGYWVFCPPTGLKNIKDSKGKIIVPLSAVEPYAKIYKTALGKYANFELNTLEDVQKFILAKYAEHNIEQKLSIHGVHSILTELLYAGYMEYEPWGVERMKGKHEGFITIETYQQVQDRLAGKAKPQLRKDLNEDFPLRNYVLCRECKHPLTAAWFKGRSKFYAYYLCKQPDCPLRSKAVLKETLEDSFADYLMGLKIDEPVLRLAQAVLLDLWDQRLKREKEAKEEIVSRVVGLELENRVLANRIAKTPNEALITQYEATITDNAKIMDDLKAESAKTKYPQERFQTALEAMINYLKSPLIQWQNPSYQKKRLLLGMYFEEKFVFDENELVKPLKLPEFLEILAKLPTAHTQKDNLVEMAGVKPASRKHRFKNWSQA